LSLNRRTRLSDFFNQAFQPAENFSGSVGLACGGEGLLPGFGQVIDLSNLTIELVDAATEAAIDTADLATKTAPLSIEAARGFRPMDVVREPFGSRACAYRFPGSGA